MYILFATCISLLCIVFYKVFIWDIWIVPSRREAILRKQAIKGPARRFGKDGAKAELLKLRALSRKRRIHDIRSHDIVSHVLPDVHTFFKLYGMPYLYWWGNEVRVTTTDPEVLRWILSKKADFFGKSPSIQAAVIPLLGYGLVTSNGAHWAQHRRVLSPVFHMEKLKHMVGTMVECATEMLTKWENIPKNNQKFEIDAESEFSFLAADIISHTAFGSSFEKGRRIFHLLNVQADLLTKLAFSSSNWLPLGRILPTRVNRELWKVRKELDGILYRLVEERKEFVQQGRRTSYGDDLLGMILTQSEADKENDAFTTDKLVGECKTFYIAGQETTASLMTWTMYLLAVHPEWQERAREEVMSECGDEGVNADILPKLKLVGMILNESLRLYPPLPVITRGAFEDAYIENCNMFIPEGAVVNIPIVAMQHDKQQWGEDANVFNPLRFAGGVAKACKHPNAFMPFSFGPRVCIGQNFALNEAKAAVAMVLRRYLVGISPEYVHCPVTGVTLKPLHGMPLIISKID